MDRSVGVGVVVGCCGEGNVGGGCSRWLRGRPWVCCRLLWGRRKSKGRGFVLLAGKGKEDGGTVWRLSGEDENGWGSLALFWESNHQGPWGTAAFLLAGRGDLSGGQLVCVFFLKRGRAAACLGFGRKI